MICHDCSEEGFVPNSLLLCGKDFAKSYADYHEAMIGAVFENWFRNTLLPNLPKGRKVSIVFDNAKYHSRLMERSPFMMNTRKDKMIAFMKKHDISIPEHVPVKAVLLERIRQAGIQKECVIDKMSKEAGFVVLRLPPYHCVLNPIEMVWGQMKYHVRHLNIFTGQSGKLIMELIKKAFAEKIYVENWRNYVQHVTIILSIATQH